MRAVDRERVRSPDGVAVVVAPDPDPHCHARRTRAVAGLATPHGALELVPALLLPGARLRRSCGIDVVADEYSAAGEADHGLDLGGVPARVVLVDNEPAAGQPPVMMSVVRAGRRRKSHPDRRGPGGYPCAPLNLSTPQHVFTHGNLPLGCTSAAVCAVPKRWTTLAAVRFSYFQEA